MKGILFKENLFNQILKGLKTETRRIIKEPKSPFNYGFTCVLDEKDFILNLSVNDGYENYYAKPRYKKGETLYMKEPYVYDSVMYGDSPLYKFDFPEDSSRELIKWSNKMFMPEKHARYFIKIDNVRIESIKDITHESIEKEGLNCPVEIKEDTFKSNCWYYDNWKSLWDKINGKTHPFDSNPIVWVYEFQLINQS